MKIGKLLGRGLKAVFRAAKPVIVGAVVVAAKEAVARRVGKRL